jgi:hypothetical protein
MVDEYGTTGMSFLPSSYPRSLGPLMFIISEHQRSSAVFLCIGRQILELSDVTASPFDVEEEFRPGLTDDETPG